MKKILRMTPGPTEVTERVRQAMANPLMNPDLEAQFFDFYQETQKLLMELYDTKGEVLILNGEGILGLEAACASFIEPGDQVLCIDNGIFGHGFIDFVKLYGGEPIVFEGPYDEPIDVDALEAFLKEHKNIKLATLVHCETPAGLVNPVDQICSLLREKGILSVVDSVSALGGEPLHMDAWHMDVVLGATQKCLSAPPGLTLVAMSSEAKEVLRKRRTPVKSFYLNLGIFDDYYEKKWFPYSQPVSDIYALHEALWVILEEGDALERHKVLGEAVREALQKGGLSLYAKKGHANTVSTVCLPQGISYEVLKEEMLSTHGILIGGAFDYLGNQVFRLGHMGENAREEKLYKTLKALDQSLKTLGVQIHGNLAGFFVEAMEGHKE
ncbi:MAG TPA: aminotransferase [Clostridiaceae bacterium]|nr:aminotransferase [Clostridiaceae bacterium]